MKTLFFNAKIYSMKSKDSVFEAMLVENEKVKQLFLQTPNLKNIQKIDLEDKYVYPGFIDTHTHSFEGGLYSSGADLAAAYNLSDVMQILSETKPVSGMVFAYRLDERKLKEKRFPTAIELDTIFPNIPVLLRRIDGHSCIINSIAAKKIDWQEKLPADFNGLLNKRWNDKAATWFHNQVDAEGVWQAYERAAQIGLRTGHTAIHTMIGDGDSNPQHFKMIFDNPERFGLEFIPYPQITNVDTASKLKSPRIGGCILADGSFGSHTAALKQDYFDKPGHKGNLYHSDDFWLDFITKAHAHDLQIAIHCIGDRAIEQILKCYEKVQQKNFKDLKHQIIHAELTDDNMLDRIKKSGISLVMQPMFDRLWAGQDGMYENLLGKKRTLRTNRLASIFARNILVTGGSDWYVTKLDALSGIDAAVNIHNLNERITPYKAIQMYTTNAASLSSDEGRLGILAPNSQADFVVTNKDILNSDNIKRTKIEWVYKKGKKRV
ncbi:MAG: amidohydrolase [Candidatus Cloacimonadota bacterium]|nr:amidohydrolase [Candidatus Cloacimonadota bacterium]